MTRYFKNKELSLFMKVDNSEGLALRVSSEENERRFESYTFGDRTMQYIVDGLEFGNVVEIEESEFRSAATKFLGWATSQISNNFKV